MNNHLPYPILIKEDLLKHPQEWLGNSEEKIVIITEDNVKNLYAETLAANLNQALLLSFAAGEASKNYQTKYNLIEKMIAEKCGRDTLILAVGGGVVGDLAGFIAATYMRGLPYMQIPTTLLAMIDSSVGGKTGINLSQGKNLVGAFWQPKKVIIDLNCLKTLPAEQIVNGLIEAIKIFLTCDVSYFKYLNQYIETIHTADKLPILKNIIERAIKLKASIVSQDPTEKHERMILNFGHTIGHALEKLSNYSMLHGYAVALGILVESKIAQLLGYLTSEDFQCIQNALQKLKINAKQLKTFDFDSIIDATYTDKKNKLKQVRYVVLTKIGKVHDEIAIPVADSIIKQALEILCEV